MNPATHPQSAGAVPPEILVVIAAAVHATYGKHARVVSIKSQDTNWEKFGRQSVFFSHRIRR